jgi:hydroxyacylglutathione hydrolase
LSFLPDFNSISKEIRELTYGIFIIPESPFLDSNIYLIKNSDEFLLVDTGNGITYQKSIDAMKKIEGFSINKIRKIIQTHCHIDHILGLYQFLKQIEPKPQIIASVQGAEIIEKADKNLIIPMAGQMMNSMFGDLAEMLTGSGIYPVDVDVKLEDGDHFDFGKLDFNVIHTPGHTEGSMCLYEADKKILFSGDTVFTKGSFGRVDFPGGSASKLKKSLEKLSKLDVEILLPGHMSPILKNGKQHLKMAYQIASNYF